MAVPTYNEPNVNPYWEMGTLNDQLNTVYSYHDATKHHYRRYARSLGFMDWSTQPDPFRRYEGAENVQLERPDDEASPTWDSLFRGEKKPAAVTPGSLSRFFFLSLALSAWKQVVSPGGEVASRWALRVNPSSGNLHPTEGYLINADGVFHYAPKEHVLEKRAGFEADEWAPFAEQLPKGAFLAGLTSIHWREAWKYGERAFRYCQHDVGHALGALGVAAARLNWRIRLLDGPETHVIDRLLGVEGQQGPEKEHGDCLVVVWPGQEPENVAIPPLPTPSGWAGVPNRLSLKHQDWPIIPEVAGAAVWPGGAEGTSNIVYGDPPTPDRNLAADRLIRGRRSAVAMDKKTALPAEAFFRLLGRLMPGHGHPVFGAAPGLDHVSLAIFVHRVDGLEPGMYALVRHPDHEASLRASLRHDFSWVPPPGRPADLPLFVLGHGDLRDPARQLSCGQDIAADGAFSLGMLARFDQALNAQGPGMYPRLFWETGMIGQMLYLEAEAAGARGTGIGCFFDDEVHRALGIEDHAWQSLYHFTVGGAVEDDRLQTASAYPDQSK